MISNDGETDGVNYSSLFKHWRLESRQAKKYQLRDIFFITLCAVICEAENWVAIEESGKARIDWFTKLPGLQHGMPAHDTFGDVFVSIDNRTVW